MPRYFLEKQVITNGVMTGTNTLTGLVMTIQTLDTFSYQTVVTGSAGPVVGVWRLFGSNDGVNFAQIGADIAQSGNGTKLVLDPGSAGNLGPHGYKFSRLDYVNTSGTGVANAFFHGKSSA